MGGLQAVTIVTISGALVFGMVLTLLGSIKLALAARLQMTEDKVGGLLSALNLALIPATLLSGILFDVWSARGVLIIGSLLSALSLGALATLTRKKSYLLVLAAILGAGAGAAFLSTGCIVLMPQAFFNDPEKTAASLNLGNVFFGVGALITPTLAWLLIDRFGFRRTILALTMLCLIPAVAALVSTFTPANQQAAFEEKHLAKIDLTALPLDWRLWVAGAVFFLYVPVEFAISTWCTSYLVEQGYKPHRAELFLSLFWVVFLASRLGVAMLGNVGVLPDWSNAGVVTVLGFLAAAILGNLAGAPADREGRGIGGTLLLAAVLGPIFPTLVGIVFRLFPDEKQHGTAYGAVFAIGSTGSLLLAPLIGAMARWQRSVRPAWRLLAFLCLGVGFAAFTLGLAMVAFRP
jgi:fucose permease